MTSCFTLTGYARLLRELRNVGYSARSFATALSPSRGDLYLRHDVDYCLRAAADMARVEYEAGMFSTWFILVRSPLFNPFGADERELLRGLRNAGCDIGLQFDASYYETIDVNLLEAYACEEVNALSVASDGPVVALSFHKPPACVHDRVAAFANLPHTSEPRFMRDALYVSDTLARFSYGDPVALGIAADCKPMQLLCHPIWWTGRSDMSGIDKLDALRELRDRLTDTALQRSVTAYGERAKGRIA